jgi:hypothetical protein
MRNLKSLIMVLLVVAASSNVFAQKKADPLGTWSFNADQAPYEYNSGDIVVGKDGKEYTAKIVFGENHELKAQSVKFEDDVLSFKVYVEDEAVYIKATVDGDKLDGKASYSEGTLTVKAERKKEK